MLRSEVISTCLVNSEYFDDMESAKVAVKSLFSQTFPKEDFKKWDKTIPNDEAQFHIERLRNETEIDFKHLVMSLSRPVHTLV